MKYVGVDCDACRRVLDVPEEERRLVGTGGFHQCTEVRAFIAAAGWCYDPVMCPDCIPVVDLIARRLDGIAPTAKTKPLRSSVRAAVGALRERYVAERGSREATRSTVVTPAVASLVQAAGDLDGELSSALSRFEDRLRAAGWTIK